MMRLKIILLFILFTIDGLTSTLEANNCDPKVSVAQILSRPKFMWSWIEGFTLNSSGSQVAYVLKAPTDSPLLSSRYLKSGVPSDLWGSQLMVTELNTKNTQNLCPKNANCFRPSWSPSGNQIAYYSDESGALGLWKFDLSTGKRRQLVEEGLKVNLRPGDEPKWSPDGKQIFITLRNPEKLKKISEEIPDKQDEIRVFLSDPSINKKIEQDLEEIQAHYHMEQMGSIVAVDCESGKKRVLVPEDVQPLPGAFRLSPSGKWISYLSVESVQDSSHIVRGLAILPRSGGTPASVVGEFIKPDWNYNYYTRHYRWHPKRDLLVFIKDGKLWKIDLESGSLSPKEIRSEIRDAIDDPLLFSASGNEILIGRKARTKPTDPDLRPSILTWVPLDQNKPIKDFSVSETENYRGVLQSGDFVTWSDGVLGFAAKYESQGNYKVVGYYPDLSKQKVLIEGNGNLNFSPQGSPALGSIIALFEDLNTPPNIFLFKEGFQNREQVTHVDSKLSEFPNIKTIRLNSKIRMKSGKNQTVHTVLLMPPGLRGKEKPATVVFGYPGDERSRFAGFFAGGNPSYTVPCEILLRNGYAVALVDLPMSDEGKSGEPIQEIMAALLPQMDALNKSRLVDPKRFALIGQSYGGYMAAAVPTATFRFKASVAITGTFDLMADYGFLAPDGSSPSIQWFEKGQGRMGESPWSDPKRYLRNSPYYLANKIHTPLLIVHGTLDNSYSQAGEMFSALRRLGRIAEFVSYPKEGHAPTSWTLGHQIDLVERILDFLKRNLGAVSCDKRSGSL